MDDTSQYFRASVVAGETFKRLQQEGHSVDEAKRMVAAVIKAEEFAVRTGRHSFDESRCIERLRQLPG
jgi:hypothetical protein